jgi:hypothetical protein
MARTAKTAWRGGVAGRSMAIEAPGTDSRGRFQQVRPGQALPENSEHSARCATLVGLQTPMNSMNFRKIPQTYCSAHAVSASALGAARRNKAQLFKTTDAVAR